MIKLDNKSFFKLLIAWFVIWFILMWILGGACTSLFVSPSEVNSVCIAKDALSGIRNVPIIGLIIPFNEFVSLFYFFAPIAGFVFAFFGINWWNNYFKTKEASSIIFPIILIIILLGGYYINLNWYYGEAATLNSRNGVKVGLYMCMDNDVSVCNETVNKLNQEYILQAQNTGASSILQLINVNYWAELRESIFLTFIFGAIAAWLPFFIKQIIDKKNE